MENRININELEPATYKALFALSLQIENSKLCKTHKELIKIRASQINGCAFCINMHTAEARRHGETEQRIYLLNAWKEIKGIYTEEERIILALTEEMTLIAHTGVTTKTYQRATALFDENYLALLMMSIITINAWNRLALATQLQPTS